MSTWNIYTQKLILEADRKITDTRVNFEDSTQSIADMGTNSKESTQRITDAEIDIKTELLYLYF